MNQLFSQRKIVYGAIVILLVIIGLEFFFLFRYQDNNPQNKLLKVNENQFTSANGQKMPIGTSIISDDKQILFLVGQITKAYQKHNHVYMNIAVKNIRGKMIEQSFMVYDLLDSLSFEINKQKTLNFPADSSTLITTHFSNGTKIVNELNKILGKDAIINLWLLTPTSYKNNLWKQYFTKINKYTSCNLQFYTLLQGNKNTVSCNPFTNSIYIYAP